MNKYGKRQSQKNLSRRSFIGKVSTATAAFTIVPGHAVSGLGHLAPSDKLNVAGIGIGGKGASDIHLYRRPRIRCPLRCGLE